MKHFMILELIVTTGFDSLVGNVLLFCWLRWAGKEGRLIVVRPSESGEQLAVRELLPTKEEVQALVPLLEPLVSSKSGPQVTANSEYSIDQIRWSDVKFFAQIDDDSATIRLDFPGFAIGKDADALRRMFRQLLVLAQVSDQTCRQILTGEEPPT